MRTALICLIVACFTLFAVNVSAQDYGFRAGDRELTLLGTGSSDDSFDNTSLSGQIGLGYFFTQAFSVSVRQGFNYNNRNGDLMSGSTRLGADFHIPLWGVFPYIGANLGYVYGDGIRDQFVAGPEVGVKIFAGPAAFIYGGLEYQVLFRSADELEEFYDDGRFVYSVGVGLVF